jgi:hypothetical protein
MVETLTAVFDRPVCFACLRVSTEPTSKPPQLGWLDVVTRMNSKGGTDTPTPELYQTLPFRERLGCSPNEACVALGIGRTLLYELIAERRVEVRKLGRRTIVSVASLLKLLDGQAAKQKSPRAGRPRKILPSSQAQQGRSA